MRHWLFAPLFGAAVALGWANYNIVLAERSFTEGRFLAKTPPINSFVRFNNAVALNPFETRYRLQLALSLAKVKSKQPKVPISKESAREISEYASSASPYHPGVMIARGSYLLNSGEWKHSGEIDRLAARLEKYAASHFQSWMVIAYWHGLAGRETEYRTALAKAGQPEHIAMIERLVKRNR